MCVLDLTSDYGLVIDSFPKPVLIQKLTSVHLSPHQILKIGQKDWKQILTTTGFGKTHLMVGLAFQKKSIARKVGPFANKALPNK